MARRAIDAIANADSPCSRLRAGAALLASDDQVFTGCIVESASFGSTSCAERTALVKAVSESAQRFEVLVIAAKGMWALMPCRDCDPALFEIAPRLRILVVGADGSKRETFLENLVPKAFGPVDVPTRSAEVSVGPADHPTHPADVD